MRDWGGLSLASPFDLPPARRESDDGADTSSRNRRRPNARHDDGGCRVSRDVTYDGLSHGQRRSSSPRRRSEHCGRPAVLKSANATPARRRRALEQCRQSTLDAGNSPENRVRPATARCACRSLVRRISRRPCTTAGTAQAFAASARRRVPVAGSDLALAAAAISRREPTRRGRRAADSRMRRDN